MSRKANSRPRDNSTTACRLADYLGETSTPLAGHGSLTPDSGSFEQLEAVASVNNSSKTANSFQTSMGDSPEGIEDIDIDASADIKDSGKVYNVYLFIFVCV